MQGDIFQLEDILRHKPKDATALKSSFDFLATKHLYEDESPLIAVYNEDDVTDYLYQENHLFSYATQPAKAPSARAINLSSQAAEHHLEAIASASGDYCTAGPVTAKTYSNQYGDEDDECAISTDDEDGSTSDEPVTPPVQIRHHHTHHIGSPPGSDLPAKRPVLERRRRDERAGGGRPKGQVVVAAAAAVTATIPREQHVDHIDGALMSWWPMPVEQLEHEWKERFYE